MNYILNFYKAIDDNSDVLVDEDVTFEGDLIASFSKGSIVKLSDGCLYEVQARMASIATNDAMSKFFEDGIPSKYIKILILVKLIK